MLVAPRVGRLHCIDPAADALEVCRRRLAGMDNAQFHLAAADTMPLADASQDFGYSLGVLHHIPDTAQAMRDAIRKLKPGAPFLVYLYYDFENRPAWFRALWKASDVLRGGISKLPFAAKKVITGAIAATVYWPLSRSAKLLEKAGMNVSTSRSAVIAIARSTACDGFARPLRDAAGAPLLARCRSPDDGGRRAGAHKLSRRRALLVRVRPTCSRGPAPLQRIRNRPCHPGACQGRRRASRRRFGEPSGGSRT